MEPIACLKAGPSSLWSMDTTTSVRQASGPPSLTLGVERTELSFAGAAQNEPREGLLLLLPELLKKTTRGSVTITTGAKHLPNGTERHD